MKTWYILFSEYENTVATAKRMVKHCMPKGCGMFVPIMMRNEEYHVNKLTTKPVYPFYIFIYCEEESQLDTILKRMESAKMYGYFLRNPDGSYATITTDDIRKIDAQGNIFTNSISKQKPVDSKYEIGDVVQIICGPMEGVTGTISSINSKYINILYTIDKGNVIELPVFPSDIQLKGENNG